MTFYTQKYWLGIALLVLAGFSSENSHAQLLQGNIVVLQVGDGSSVLNSASAPLFLKEFNTTTAGQTSPVSSVSFPVTGAGRIVNSGSATSEGQITLSSDSTRIVLAGYDTTVGVASIASSTAANIARAIDTVSLLGIPGSVDTTKSAYSGNNLRCATRNNGENYWGAGGSTGTYYFGNVAAPAVVQSANTNTRVILAANGNLYYSSASGTPAIYRIAGQPTTSSTPAAFITVSSGTGTPSPYSFAINSTENIAYVADDRTAAGAGGGIQKWTLSGTTWSLAYTLSPGSGIGTRSVIADWSTSPVSLYAVTTGGALIKYLDSNGTAAPFTLATAGTNTAFRSVAFVPSCKAPSLSTSVSNISCSTNGSVTLTVTGGSNPATYAWTGPASFSASTQNITNLAAGTYNVVVTTVGGCTASTTATIVNNSSVSAVVTPAGPLSFCGGGSVVLNANTGTGLSYQWYRNSVLISGASSASYTASLPGSYTVVVTSGVNCSATSSPITATINPAPTVIPSVTNVLCNNSCNGTITIAASGAATPYTYAIGTGAYASSPSFTSLCAGTITIHTKDANNCIKDTSITITQPSALVVSASITTPILCSSPGTVTVIGTGGTSGYQYKLGVNGTYGPSNVFNGLAAGTDTFFVQDANNCVGSSIVSLNGSSAPSATITPAGPLSVCQTTTLRTNSAIGLTYIWKLNGSPIAGATDSILNVTASGSYSVTVSSGTSCSATSTAVAVTVNPRPIVAPSLTNVLCNGACNGTISIAASGATSPYTYAIGTGSFATSSSFTGLCPGTVTVHTKDANGCVKDTIVTITQPTSLAATATITVPVTCNQSGSVTVTPSGGAGIYQYKLGLNGTYGGGGVFPGLTAGVDTFFVKDANNCTVSTIVTLNNTGSIPSAPITSSGALAFCAGNSVMLKTNSNPVLSYVWKLNGNPIIGATDSFLVVSSPGTYTVTVTSIPNCIAISSPAVVTVNALPIPTPVLLTSSVLCAGDTVRIRANTAAGYSYQWSLNGARISGNLDSVLKVVITNTITVPTALSFRSIITNASNCMDSSSVIGITAMPLPQPVIARTGSVLTAGTWTSYQWYRNGIAIPGATNVNYAAAANGSYTIKVANSFGCSSTSLPFDLTNVGVMPTIASYGIRIYPNPVYDMVTIDAPMELNAIIRDLQGREVLRCDKARQVSMKQLANGVYSLTLYTNAGTVLGMQLLTKSGL